MAATWLSQSDCAGSFLFFSFWSFLPAVPFPLSNCSPKGRKGFIQFPVSFFYLGWDGKSVFVFFSSCFYACMHGVFIDILPLSLSCSYSPFFCPFPFPLHSRNVFYPFFSSLSTQSYPSMFLPSHPHRHCHYQIGINFLSFPHIPRQTSLKRSQNHAVYRIFPTFLLFFQDLVLFAPLGDSETLALFGMLHALLYFVTLFLAR